jgi:hypothetical protein
MDSSNSKSPSALEIYFYGMLFSYSLSNSFVMGILETET